jgi:hypothetical protein
MPDTEAGERLLSDNSIRISGIAPHPHGDWVINCWLCEAIAAIEAEAVAAERERIANLFPRFIQGEMFDETPENDLDLDATAFAVGERFRFLVGAYPYRQADLPLGHGYTCGICPWGRIDQPRGMADYVAHMNAEHPTGPLLEGDDEP